MATDYNCRVVSRILILSTLAPLLVACAPATGHAVAPTGPAFVTATLPGSAELSGTPRAETPTATATPTSVTGATTTEVNVRQQPMASARVLGTLAASTSVDVFARDPVGNWFQIAYAAGDDGRGWVAAQYISVPDKGAVPLAGAAGGPTASVRERINVRSGPGTQFDAVGLLGAGDVVTLTGKDQTGTWMQIRFAGGADGLGWVAASFLESAETQDLPILSATGELLGTSTPSHSEPSATPTPETALEDGDSSTMPAVDTRFSPGGAGSVFYSSDLSTPVGDKSDWIQFAPYYDSIAFRLDCRGNGTILAEVTNQGVAVAGLPVIACGFNQSLALKAGNTYELVLSVSPVGDAPAYVTYTASLFAVPSN